ncbi:phage shock protein PspA [Agaribacterium haliotis]|uniref:phage shock protein PspA n=1 Tax=Agaribacterium haliotis TaxID=2013869 RepID=UPI000BB55D4F|nr:phage shock protein PspA [Agaribacterium haliotis]
MGIFSRFADIVNANINAMLDGAEDPAKMIRLIIQEMEETLVELRSSCARLLADKKTLQRRSKLVQDEALQWQDKARLALSKDREDLARAALAEKAEAEQAVAAFELELQSIDEQLAGLEDEVSQLQARLDEAKARQQELTRRSATAEQRLRAKKQLHERKVDNTLNKFELFQRRLDELEGKVESYELGKRDLAQEIEELGKDDELSRELERLKKEMQDQ